jgi:cytochrome c553
VTLLAVFIVTLGTPLFAAPGRQDAEELFEKRVRPLLAANCYECHGAHAKKIEGGLVLETAEGWLRGGDSGPVLVPGNPDESRLIRAVRYTDHDLEMPPSGKLADAEIALLESWVKAGAAGIATTNRPDTVRAHPSVETKMWTPGGGPAGVDAARGFWSFRPVEDRRPPEVRDRAWIHNDLDRFVLAKLEGKGLAPAPPADRRTWLRRVTWDLTGLPPTDPEIQQFLADATPQAFEKVVDRLLASPAYGERWARHWLDVARYADSNGLDENLALGNAYRYRDYVVRAFNADKPYDEFIMEQLAGDLLPPTDDKKQLFDRITATGFLVLGPKMLAEQDKEKLLMDTVDEQIDVTAKAFLGLTAGCARCHDHKFDPIPARDYYALAGVFRSTSTFDNTGFVSRWRQRELATASEIKARDEWKASRARAGEALETATRDARARLLRTWHADFAKYLIAGQEAARDVLVLEAEDFSRGTLGIDRETWGTPETVIVRTMMPGPQFVEYDITVPTGGRYELQVRMASGEKRPMKLFAGGVELGVVLGESTGSFYPDGQRWHPVSVVELKPGRNTIRLEGTVASVPHLDTLLFSPASEVSDSSPRPLAGDSNGQGLEHQLVRNFAVFLARTARASDPLFDIWNRMARIARDHFTTHAATTWRDLRAERDSAKVHFAPAMAALLDAEAPTSLAELAARYQTLFGTVDAEWRSVLDRAAKEKRKAPERLDSNDLEALRLIYYGPRGPFALPDRTLESLYSAEEQAGIAAARRAVDDLEKSKPAPFASALAVVEGSVADLPVHVRGSHLNKAKETVPRGFLTILDHALPQPPIPANASGRLELARWIADGRNPLTARVMVNRIWQGHFGEGLVRTPSNFGLRGDTPSHPELLDWLAARFVQNGWSIKALHRLIVLSATYRMSSDGAPSPSDPENRLLARMNRRRLDAESIRDLWLAVSGRLDRTEGGSLLEIKDGEYVTNDQSNDQARYSTPRRTLYLPIIRNSMFDLFSSFDYNDSSVPVDRRPVTTAAHQSLFLLNSPLAMECAESLADALRATPGSDDDRIVAAWTRIIGRPASSREREQASAFLAQVRGIERGPAPPVEAGGPPASSPAPSRPARGEGDIERVAWRSLCQALLASNDFLYID